jgi:hypothetical protein
MHVGFRVRMEWGIGGLKQNVSWKDFIPKNQNSSIFSKSMLSSPTIFIIAIWTSHTKFIKIKTLTLLHKVG